MIDVATGLRVVLALPVRTRLFHYTASDLRRPV